MHRHPPPRGVVFLGSSGTSDGQGEGNVGDDDQNNDHVGDDGKAMTMSVTMAMFGGNDHVGGNGKAMAKQWLCW